MGGEGQDVLAGGEGDDQLYGDAYNPSLSNTSEGSATPDSSASSQELLSNLGVSTASTLLDFWVRLEAEDMKLGKYNADEQADASQGGVISTNGKGKARTKFSGPSGTYKLVVGYYDDNANASEATLEH